MFRYSLVIRESSRLHADALKLLAACEGGTLLAQTAFQLLQ